MPCVIAIDAGTTGVRALAVAENGAVVDVSYRELTQYFPRPAWVEHDATAIWEAVAETVAEVAERQHAAGRPVAAIGHHQPTRDRGRLGPVHGASPAPGHRVAGPSYRGPL